MTEKCSLCTATVKDGDGLSCSTCKKPWCVRCGTGLIDIGERTVHTYLKDCVFKCSICTFAENNAMIHKVITSNQIYNEKKHATVFDLGDTLIETASRDDDADAAVSSDSDTVIANSAVNSSDNRDDEPSQDVGDISSVDTSPVHSQARGQRRRQALTTASALEFPDPSMAPPEQGCVDRAKKLSYILRTLKYIPHHPNSIFLGDSHLTGVDGKDIDPTDNQARVRSVGGLCIVSTVVALSQHKLVHQKFKNVIFVLGTNDCLHINQHCLDDRYKYFRLLYQEAKRIFPRATINFVTPFSGLTGVSETYLSDLVKDIKYACPNIKVYRPPSMKNKIGKKGIHLNKSGRELFSNFLRSKFIIRKQRVFSSDSGRSGQRREPEHDCAVKPVATDMASGYSEQIKLNNSDLSPQASGVHMNDTTMNSREPLAQVETREPSLRGPRAPGYIMNHGNFPYEFQQRANYTPPVMDARAIAATVADELIKQQQLIYRNYFYPPPPNPTWRG